MAEKHCVNSELEEAKKGYKVLATLILFIASVLLIRSFLIEAVTVGGKSMNPTFSSGDVVLQKKIGVSLERFDVVIIDGAEKNLIKRIIALPNETVQIVDGFVYVNGTQLAADRSSDLIQDAGCAAEPLQLASDEYFVLGDNRNASTDSRSFGAVKKNQIEGEVMIRIMPLKNITTNFERGVA